ncbi:MAG: transglutaminase domain-containing protein [Vicingaceae bacterium]|nr:transglutaminase domain-containing protein [Vicingaceae bacterium]
MQFVGVFIFVFFLIIFCYFVFKEIQEFLFLKKKLTEIIKKPCIDSINDLIAIKNYLQTNISYNSELKTKKRPLLRHTASETLTSKYGFCGENARVAIKLLLIGGIKANRVYLYRKEWQHVLIEHKYKDHWYMFDGHYDENTLFEDRLVAKILSEDISEYPNTYPNNPYLNFCRLKLFYKIPFLQPFSKVRLPSFIVYLFESPHLIKSLGLAFFCLISLVIVKSYNF